MRSKMYQMVLGGNSNIQKISQMILQSICRKNNEVSRILLILGGIYIDKVRKLNQVIVEVSLSLE